VPPIGGFFSAATGTNVREHGQPLLEKGLNINTRRVNVFAILVEATADWIITILNLYAGLIRLELWIFTGLGVMERRQIGTAISRYLPERLLKAVFSISVVLIGIFNII
jgi:uncharacterized membrane protein YfcA